jgi:hypothetical protein
LEKEKFAWQKAQDEKSSGGSSGGSGGIKKSSSSGTSGGSSSSGSINKESSSASVEPSENTSSEPEVDTDSIMALGYGPITEQKLNSLVSSGVVEEYVSGNKIKFRKSASALKQ